MVAPFTADRRGRRCAAWPDAARRRFSGVPRHTSYEEWVSACSRTSAMRSPSTRITRQYWLWVRVPRHIATSRGDAEPHLSVKEPDPFTQSRLARCVRARRLWAWRGPRRARVSASAGCERVHVRCTKPGRGRRRMRNRLVGALVILSLAAALSGATGVAGARTGAARGEPVTVASFDFAESRLLAEIYAQALERSGLRVRRAFGLGPRELVAPALREGLDRRRARVRRHGGAVPERGPRASRGRCRGDPRRSGARAAGDRGPGARARPGAGHQRLRRPPRGRRASRAHADERPPRGRAAADLRRAARVRDPAALPRRPAQGLRHRVRRGRAARRRRSPDPPGARHRHRRRRAALQHRPGRRHRRPRRAGRRPRAAAGRERHADRAPRRGRPLRNAPGHGARRGVRHGWTPTRCAASTPGRTLPTRSGPPPPAGSTTSSCHDRRRRHPRHPGRRGQWSAHRPPQPPAAPPHRCAPAAAPQHRHDRHRLARRRGRAGDPVRGRDVVRRRRPARQPGRLRHPPAVRRPPHGVAHRRRRPDRSPRFRLGDQRDRVRLADRAGRAATVAAPLHLHRRHVRDRDHRRRDVPLVGPPAAVRRAHHRPVGRLVVLRRPRRRDRADRRRDRLHAGGRRSQPADRQDRHRGRGRRLRVFASSTWGRSIRPTSSSA